MSYWDWLPQEIKEYIEEFCYTDSFIEGKECKIWYISNNDNPFLHRINDKPAVVYEDNYSCEYWINGIRHRDNDKPALITKESFKYFKYGKLHRDNDEPAVIESCGTKKWYKHDLLHRSQDKPAIEYYDGMTEYWVNGILDYGIFGYRLLTI